MFYEGFCGLDGACLKLRMAAVAVGLENQAIWMQKSWHTFCLMKERNA